MIRTYKCLNCGAPAEFNDNENKIRCPYCDTLLLLVKENDNLKLTKIEKDSSQPLKAEMAWENEQAETWSVSIGPVSTVNVSILPDSERIYVPLDSGPLESDSTVVPMPKGEDNEPVVENQGNGCLTILLMVIFFFILALVLEGC